MLVVVVSVPRLSRKFLVLPTSAVVVVGTLVFAFEGLHFNLADTFHYKTTEITGSLAFAVLHRAIRGGNAKVFQRRTVVRKDGRLNFSGDGQFTVDGRRSPAISTSSFASKLEWHCGSQRTTAKSQSM